MKENNKEIESMKRCILQNYKEIKKLNRRMAYIESKLQEIEGYISDNECQLCDIVCNTEN